MSQRFVEFSWKGRRYRAWDEGADMVSLERIQNGERRPVGMPGTALLEAGRAALADRSDTDGSMAEYGAVADRPFAGEKLVLEGFLPRLAMGDPRPEPFVWNGAVVVRRYRITVEEILEDDAVIVGRLHALQRGDQARANRYDYEAIATWARSERYRLAPDHLPPGVRTAKAAQLEALVSLAESIPKRGGLAKKDRPAAWDEFEMLRGHLTPNARGVRLTDIADGGELEWMVCHARNMLVSYAERCGVEDKHALRQKISDGIKAAMSSEKTNEG